MRILGAQVTAGAINFELASVDAIDLLLHRQMIRFVRHPMNFVNAASTNHYSTREAAAAVAASDARRFNEYAHALFVYQPPEGGPGLTDDQLIALGQTIGVTDHSFASEIEEGRYLPWPSFVTQRAFARRRRRPDLIVAAAGSFGVTRPVCVC